jgi:5'-deoxynucleotidase YfbR-like HD superfamily hydrolase
MLHFYELYAAGAIKRWHVAHTIKEQDLAAHSWGVAMICAHIEPKNYKLMMAALVHDLSESETGDIPYQVKKIHVKLAKEAKEVEGLFNRYHGLEFNLTEYEEHCLKWADMFELYLFTLREMGMGNQYMLQVHNRAVEALNHMTAPNETARMLWNKRGEHAWNHRLQVPVSTTVQV